jgi:hypothetical protein
MDVCQEHSGMVEGIKNIDKKCEAILSDLRSTREEIWGRVNKHIDEAPAVRQKVVEIDTELRLHKEDTKREFIKAKEEKLNSIKASQWRIGLIVATVMGIISTGMAFVIAKWIK